MRNLVFRYGRRLTGYLARNFDLEIIRLATHRGHNLFSDLRRIGFDPSTVLLDVGANVGRFTVSWKKWFPESRVLAIEPVPEVFSELKLRTSHDQLVSCINKAAGEGPGVVTMTSISGELSGQNRIVFRDKCKSNIKLVDVEKVDVDSVCQEYGVRQIGLLKSDCEGYDLNVLKGARRMLADGNVMAVYCEIDFLTNGTHGSFYDIDFFLKQYGFCCYGFYDYSGVNYHRRNAFSNALWLPIDGIT